MRQSSTWRVLSSAIWCAFFETANRSLWPDHLIVERNRELNLPSGGDVNDLLAERGYSLRLQHGDNYVWSLQAS